ncbi:UNVERIFIED_ORG: Ig-like protein group 1 [Citrobacter freundii]
MNNNNTLYVGLEFPLLTTGVDYRRGKNGADDTRLNLGLTYRIGEPLAHQLDSSRVGAQRSLVANRLELVNRNNDVVLEYRKQTLITLQLPPDVYGAELTTVTLTPQVNAKYGLSRIEPDDAELRQAGGKIISNTGNQITLQLPAWSSDRQSITLSGRARDTRGNLSDIARTRILVSSAVQQQLAVSTDKTTATADGADSVRYTLTVTGSDGKPVSGQAVRWEHNGGTLNGENTTNADGVAIATLTSQTAGIIRVAATTRNQTAKAADVTFVAAMQGELLADRTQALADGQEAVSYTLTLRTTDGKPLSGKNVTFTTTAGQLSQTQGTTDQNGQLSVQLTSTRAGQAVVNATVDGRAVSAQPVTFTRTVRGVITVEKERVYPGSTQTVTLTLTDAAGNPVSGERVDWHADSGKLWQTQGTTDAQGRATSTTPGTATITADAYGQQYTAPVITVMPALTVSSVTGIDATGADGQNFGKRVPDNTWPGAKYRIDTENAAGTVTWTASSPAVSINGNVMTVKSNPAGVTLTGTDTDGQIVTLNMGSNWFAQSATKYEWLSSDYEGTAIHSCRQLGAQVASSAALQGVISEWGELETYDGWTNLKNDWLYSSTTVISGNGVKSTIAYLFPGGKEGLLTGIRGYYACR